MYFSSMPDVGPHEGRPGVKNVEKFVHMVYACCLIKGGIYLKSLLTYELTDILIIFVSNMVMVKPVFNMILLIKVSTYTQNINVMANYYLKNFLIHSMWAESSINVPICQIIFLLNKLTKIFKLSAAIHFAHLRQ